MQLVLNAAREPPLSSTFGVQFGEVGDFGDHRDRVGL